MRRAVSKEIPFKEFTPHVAPPDLAADIARVQQDIVEFIDRKVAELKASRDGASQPEASLRQMLIRGDCPCRAAQRLLNE